MTEITIKSSDGGSFSAYVSGQKEADEGAPVVVVIQEIFGVNGVMRGICDNLAYQGYVAVCPDLFWRQEPNIQLTDHTEEEWARAFELYKGFDEEKGVDDLIATVNHMRGYPGTNGKVGTIGFCLGGKLAYLMATSSDADCNVSYYGVGIQDALDRAPKIKNPLLMHIAEKDQFVPPEAQEKIIKALSDYDHVELFHYQGVDHAFARIGGEHFDENAAREANVRTADFLARNLLTAEQRKASEA